ncbi:longitudinals lacking protein, isoforms N/O/W/X/Y-like [Choristoneura fumiferana]|uniref:longitudinals lacking protein, isoforms N/O/W/X/Y-like n=1 Tax=Choristoneura fumiferana TaxID=7141 RepID=UPI003D15C70E
MCRFRCGEFSIFVSDDPLLLIWRQPKESTDAKDNLICTVTREDDGSKTFSCNTCGNTFKQRQYFRLHYKHVHLKQRPKTRPCTICGAQLTPHKHARHLEQVHGKPAPSCGACGRKFSFPFEVIRHQKTFHMGEKHFQCDKCSMTFSHKKNLNLHIMKHQDVKNFKCKLCGKAFKWRNNLTEHEKTHVKIKKHVCGVCEAAFVKHRSLQHHVKLRHPEAM